jgi:hypothetical protein
VLEGSCGSWATRKWYQSGFYCRRDWSIVQDSPGVMSAVAVDKAVIGHSRGGLPTRQRHTTVSTVSCRNACELFSWMCRDLLLGLSFISSQSKLYFFICRMMLVPHSKHTYGPPWRVTRIASLSYMQMMFVPHRKHLWTSTACYRDSFNFYMY